MCEYCEDIELLDAYKLRSTVTDEYGLLLAEIVKGKPVLIAWTMQDGDFFYFGSNANFCPKCGRDLRGESNG